MQGLVVKSRAPPCIMCVVINRFTSQLILALPTKITMAQSGWEQRMIYQGFHK